ncbi:MAG TPA: prolyl oligopeptidase family serine peptidase [Bacteroidales bacterium]|nr:prolyl oligopeptidase family serine peptidase [Bacteroidales bacterium]
MKITRFFLLFVAWQLVLFNIAAQTPVDSLTVKKIMQDPSEWIGPLPENIYWSKDSKTIYFNRMTHPGEESGLFSADIKTGKSKELSTERINLLPSKQGVYNEDKSVWLYSKNGDVFIRNIKKGSTRQLTNTAEKETDPHFTHDETAIVFTSDQNLFMMELAKGSLQQLTNFKKGSAPSEKKKESNQDEWLKKEQEDLFQVIRDRERIEKEEKKLEKELKPSRPEAIYTGKSSVLNLQLSPDQRYITYNLYTPANGAEHTEIPHFVTKNGYTETVNARTKVGAPQASLDLYIYDIEKDTVYGIKTKDIPGIKDQPAYYHDYPRLDTLKPAVRPVYVFGPYWSKDGNYAAINVRSQDNKDRWVMLLDLQNGEPKQLDRQHDSAWIGGPGIGWSLEGGLLGWMPDNKRVYYQSEETGYSHLYTVNVETGEKAALTSGRWEVYDPSISADKKSWYFTANIGDPEVRQFYRMPLNGGDPVQLTAGTGNNEVTLSPDEKWLAVRFSTANQPWELYLQQNKPGAQKKQLTHSLSAAFKAYDWRMPEFVTFTARDGANVHARLYRPEHPAAGKPAVIFVHGAGYLQNAHKWWSDYFREYMFHNLLVDHGYTVLDIDYRGSAGYGRNWRTAIYRHMGGKDLDDQVDGAKYLAGEYGINPARIGIYGGSYGGFITLMAMFTTPGTFHSGAALRSVTDWAHYNHPYTANILNTPALDSIAYARSSPINFAAGLQGNLLMCHGMVDDNVHFQDIVRLTQRLIELGKHNWELAVYPVEKHGFVRPSSWTDEYSRIYKLFEETLKK